MFPFLSPLDCPADQNQRRCPSPRQWPFQDLLAPNPILVSPSDPPEPTRPRAAHQCGQTFPGFHLHTSAPARRAQGTRGSEHGEAGSRVGAEEARAPRQSAGCDERYHADDSAFRHCRSAVSLSFLSPHILLVCLKVRRFGSPPPPCPRPGLPPTLSAARAASLLKEIYRRSRAASPVHHMAALRWVSRARAASKHCPASDQP